MNYDITDYLKDDKELQKAVIQEFLNEIAKLKAENERLKEENEKLNKMTGIFSARLCKKYRQTLQEIKEYLRGHKIADKIRIKHILDLITKAEEE